MASKPRQKAPKTDPKPKLKTMNEISAAEAAKLFHAARNFDCDGYPGDDYCLNPENFPHDIAARDFLQCLELYSKMVSEGSEYPFASKTPSITSYTVEHRHMSDAQRDDLVKVSQSLSEKDLERLLKRTPKVLEAVNVLRENPDFQDKEIGAKLGRSYKTIRAQLSTAYRILRVADRIELLEKLPPKT